jgi:hypothetical protein
MFDVSKAHKSSIFRKEELNQVRSHQKVGGKRSFRRD